MKKNVGKYEATVRGVIGAGALALAVSQRNALWLIVSVLSFSSALTHKSVLNEAFGIDTYREGEDRQEPEPLPTIH